MNKPVYIEGVECKLCHTTDTVALNLPHSDDNTKHSRIVWCENGCHYYDWFDGAGQNLRVYHKGVKD